MAADSRPRRKRPAAFSISILDQRWHLKFLPPSRMPRGESNRPDWGNCDPNTRTIKISTGQSPLESLDTIIHEIFHASRWELSEDAVENTATHIASILWMIGWQWQVKPGVRIKGVASRGRENSEVVLAQLIEHALRLVRWHLCDVDGAGDGDTLAEKVGRDCAAILVRLGLYWP